MLSNPTNLGNLTPIHTDFGSNTGDLLVAEYDVPQTKVKKTLFYKHGQLPIPKWALIPAGIAMFGLLIALCAIIVNAILSQKSTTVTYSQTCSKTSVCQTGVGLICGSQSICVCSSTQYWYQNQCVNQPTYTKQCNQTTECRTDLGLVCAEIQGQCNCPTTTAVQTCDCPSTWYWTGSTCTPRLSYSDACNAPAGTSYQCISNLYCDGSVCTCAPGTQYWNSTASECYSVDEYRSLCNLSTANSCDGNASLVCLQAGEGAQCPLTVPVNTTSCDCENGTYWNGGSCVSKKTINVACFWNCECNSLVGLQCLNQSCTCPQKTHWSAALSACDSQMNYTQPCTNTSDCNSVQGLTCYVSGTPCNCPVNLSMNMCDCSTAQYYDYNLTSCQSAHSYNETCYGNYMCDSSIGLFCQTTVGGATNCSCPEPMRLYMCDCNTTSYWNGVACVSRLPANESCSYPYQCQANLTCIVNETTLGIFSDVCRCPLGSFYRNGSGCVASYNYTQSCVGSYQCYESAPLSCRYIDSGLTCLDSSVNALPACDCSDYYYFNAATSLCAPLLNRTSNCTSSCQCISPYQCVSGKCNCINFYSSINQTCVQYLAYGDQCTNSSQCSATPNALMTCINGTCGCNSTGYWSGTKCQFSINFRSTCSADQNCYAGLKCRAISCIDSNSRCSCPVNTYFSALNQSCAVCNGTNNGYEKFVINYPTSDLCVAVFFAPSQLANSIAFATADSQCRNLTVMPSASTPQLLSVHNQTELNCIATVLEAAQGSKTCSASKFQYLGYISANATFYDGTLYSSTFSSPAIQTFACLAYCYNSNNTGSLYFEGCNDYYSGNSYGAICDYRVH